MYIRKSMYSSMYVGMKNFGAMVYWMVLEQDGKVC